jgi:hypothetical protein
MLDMLALSEVWLTQNGDALYVDRFDIASPADQIVNLEDFAVLASEWLMMPPVTAIMAE